MTVEQLEEVMKFHLKNFDDEGVEITNDTVLSTILSDSDGVGAANSKFIFRAVMRWTLTQNGQEDKRWPTNWVNMSVAALAAAILPSEGS